MWKILKFMMITVALFALLCVSASAKILVIDNMDDITPWTGNGTVSLETENVKEGTGAIRCDDSNLLQIQRNFTEPLDLSAYEDDGVISVWVYVDNTDTFDVRDNQFEFTSSGTCDVEESAINIGNEWFEPGWNHFLFTMYDFSSFDADWSRINFIRMYKFVTGPNYWIWDDIRIGLESDFGIGKVKVGKGAQLVESFDDSSKFNVDTEYAIEGTGCATATGTAPIIIEHKYDTPMDLSVLKDNGYVYLWVYVENAAALQKGDGQFELTSSGTSDVNELSWPLHEVVEFKDGWNELLLPVDPNTECDLSAVNYLCLYLSSATENTIKIDRLMVGTGPDFGQKPPVTEPPATEAPATEAPTEEETEAPAAGETSSTEEGGGAESGSSTAIIAIIIAAVIIVAIVVIIIAASKKKSGENK